MVAVDPAILRSLQKEDEQTEAFYYASDGKRGRESNFSSESGLMSKDCDMIRILFFSFLVLVIHQNGTSGKPIHRDFSSFLQVGFSDAAEPSKDLQTKRNSYYSSRVPEMLSPADPSSLCYFIQESETQSQISCRLRFTRSRFNFNPFGLRFGKRQGGVLPEDERKTGSWSSHKILQAVLKPRLDRMMDRCGDNWGEDC